MGQLASEVASIFENKEANKEIQSERKKILKQIESDEKAKVNLVNKNLAKQKAIYGASGMSGKSMTEEAVLKRLRNESEESFSDKKRTNLDKLSKLKTKKKNLLTSLLDAFNDIMK